MAASHRTRLVEIKKEVGELHPLLDRLFRKHPQITEVEYTHGSNEKGADFVLSRPHEVFKSAVYIGVIAKVGRILQDYAGVERQIEECNVSRTFFGGKKKIRPDEIWVVTTQTISANAQEKIYEKYKTTKIFFIDGDRLGDLIDEYMPDYWTNVDLEVGRYLTELREQNEIAERKFTLLPIDKTFYIEQDITRVEKGPYSLKARRRQRESKVNIEEEIKKHRIILIEGGMGAGKSRLLRKLVERYTQPEVYIESKILPVAISFKELCDNYSGEIEKVVEKQVGNIIDSKCQEESTYLILIDAVDEKNINMDEQVKYIDLIKSSVYKNSKFRVVITSRYLRSTETSNELSKEISRYEMGSLSLNRVIDFLDKICSTLNIRKRIIEDLKKSQLFKELPRSPIAAILLAHLLQENSQNLPSNMTELYSKYLELMLGRWTY